MDDIINLDIRQHLVNLDTCPLKLLTIQEVFLSSVIGLHWKNRQREVKHMEAC